MNKIKTFQSLYLSIVQSEVNDFAKKYKIINASICTEKRGDFFAYTILVLYEE